MENEKVLMEALGQVDKRLERIDIKVNKLYDMFKELDQRTSLPLPNLKLNLDGHSDPVFPPIKIENEVKPNLKHYYENFMPRLDKYLAYLEIESNQFPDKKAIYLITNHCNFEFTSIRHSNARASCILINFRKLVDIKTFKKRTVQFRFDGKNASFETLRTTQQTFERCVNKLANGKELTVGSIYGGVKNEFRTIKIKDCGNAYISIWNTVYSSYGCMEENKPLYKETIYMEPTIHVYS